MKRFQFRLERVLKLKKQRERLAELWQHQAHLAVEAARARVANLQEELARAARALQGHVGQPTTAGAWLIGTDHALRVGKALGAAETEVRHAEQELREAAAARTRLTTEVEALLHLRQTAWEVHAEERQRAVQRQLDELSMRGWLANQAVAGSRTIRPLSGGETP